MLRSVPDWKRLQRALEYATRNPSRNVTLRELAARTEQSLFHTHRMLRAVLGETPKHFTLRLRLDRAAAALVSSQVSILDIALTFGFESHEAFCRAFRRRFRTSPSAYRKRGLTGLAGPSVRRHVDLVAAIGPCVGLYHVDLEAQRRRSASPSCAISSQESRSQNSMEYKISKQQLAGQPVLVVRRRVRRADIAATIGGELPKVFLHAQQKGIALAGYPITRYLETSVGWVTLETGMRVSAHPGDWTGAEGSGARGEGPNGETPGSEAPDSEGKVLAETLPAGPAAVTIHFGPYDQLQTAYAAVEEWILANGFHPRSAPWEAYLNDPTDLPNPQDWKTEVCWPIQD